MQNEDSVPATLSPNLSGRHWARTASSRAPSACCSKELCYTLLPWDRTPGDDGHRPQDMEASGLDLA